MRTVYKYLLTVDDEVVVTMHEGARLLHLGQHLDARPNELVLWAEVDTDEPPQERTFRIYGTGHSMPEDEPLHYVGTVDVFIGAVGSHLVWHVYELRSPEHFQRRELVAEASNDPGWIGEAHGPRRTGKGNGR